MTPEVVMDLLADALYLTVVMVAVIVGPSLAVGLLVSTFWRHTKISWVRWDLTIAAAIVA